MEQFLLESSADRVPDGVPHYNICRGRGSCIVRGRSWYRRILAVRVRQSHLNPCHLRSRLLRDGSDRGWLPEGLTCRVAVDETSSSIGRVHFYGSAKRAVKAAGLALLIRQWTDDVVLCSDGRQTCPTAGAARAALAINRVLLEADGLV